LTSQLLQKVGRGGEERPCLTLGFPLPKWRPRLAYALRAAQERWLAR